MLSQGWLKSIAFHVLLFLILIHFLRSLFKAEGLGIIL